MCGVLNEFGIEARNRKSERRKLKKHRPDTNVYGRVISDIVVCVSRLLQPRAIRRASISRACERFTIA